MPEEKNQSVAKQEPVSSSPDAILDSLRSIKGSVRSLTTTLLTLLNSVTPDLDQIEDKLTKTYEEISRGDSAIKNARVLLRPREGKSELTTLEKGVIRRHKGELTDEIRKLKDLYRKALKQHALLVKTQKTRVRLTDIRARSSDLIYVQKNEGHIKNGLSRLVLNENFKTRTKAINLRNSLPVVDGMLPPEAIALIDPFLRSEAPELYIKCTGRPELKNEFYQHFAHKLLAHDLATIGDEENEVERAEAE